MSSELLREEVGVAQECAQRRGWSCSGFEDEDGAGFRVQTPSSHTQCILNKLGAKLSFNISSILR